MHHCHVSITKTAITRVTIAYTHNTIINDVTASTPFFLLLVFIRFTISHFWLFILSMLTLIKINVNQHCQYYCWYTTVIIDNIIFIIIYYFMTTSWQKSCLKTTALTFQCLFLYINKAQLENLWNIEIRCWHACFF